MKQPWRDITLLKAIAGRLRELRAEKGVSQETVYEDTGIHIGKIETEKYNITVSTLARLCRYYGISLRVFRQAVPAAVCRCLCSCCTGTV